METFSALLAICAGNSPVPGEFPAQRPVTRSFNVFFDLRLNKQLSKQSRGWWLETPSRPLWRHRNMLPRFAIWSVNVLSVGLDYLTLNFSHNTCKMIHGLESTIIFCTYHASMLMWYLQTFMIINHGKFDYYLMIVKIYQAGLSKIFQETFCWKVAQLLYETNSYCSQILSTIDLKAHSIWNVYKIIHSFAWTSHEMHFVWSSNKRRMNWIWIITWCFRIHFICITYVLRSYETHMNFKSILYELYMNLSWTSPGICWGRHMWTLCKLHMNSIQLIW